MMANIIYFAIFTLIYAAAVNCSDSSSSSSAGASSFGAGNSNTFTSTSQTGGNAGPYGTPNVGATGGYAGPYGTPNIGDTYGSGYGYNPYPNLAPPVAPIYTPSFPPSSPFGYQTPFQPQQSLTPQEFNDAISQYLNSLQQHYANLYRQQQEWLNAWQQAQTQNYFGPNPPNYAYATGTYGPNGIHQTAGISPPNSNKPNVNVFQRFDEEDIGNGGASNGGANAGKPGFVGISTSSFSSSSDVNGHKTHKEGAITTVNDNGKITTHKVES